MVPENDLNDNGIPDSVFCEDNAILYDCEDGAGMNGCGGDLCFDCEPGTFSQNGEWCELCSPDSYAGLGAYMCEECPPGLVSNGIYDCENMGMPGVIGCGGDSCVDCAGIPNGDNWESNCGCVAVDNSGDDCDDCAGVPNGYHVADNCGTCDLDSSNDCIQDCAGVWGGSNTDCSNVTQLEGTWIILGGEEQESTCNPSELNFGENQNPCAGYMQFDENLTGSYYVCCDGSAILSFNMTAVLSESGYTVTKTSGTTSGSIFYLIVNDDETITAYPEVDDGSCMIHVFSQGTPDCSNCTECN